MINAHAFIAADQFEQIPDLLSLWQSDLPACGCLVLLPDAEVGKVDQIQLMFNRQNLPLLGAVFPQLIVGGEWHSHGALILRFNEMPSAFLKPLAEGSEASFAQEVECFLAEELSEISDSEPKPTLMLMFDALLPNIGKTLHQLFQSLHTRVTYAGVNAGSETFQPTTCLFDNDQLLQQAVIGILLHDLPKIAVEHGYPVSKALLKATSTVGNQIHKIDGQVAFDAYQAVIESEYGVKLTRENFYEYAVHFPFGLVTTLDVLVRIPVGFTDEGTLICVGEVPANSMLRLLRAPKLQDSVCVERLAQTLCSAEDEHDSGILTFYCAGRKMHFGTDSLDELNALKHRCGTQDLFGALTLGEIDTDSDLGMPRFHNATLVCVPTDR